MMMNIIQPQAEIGRQGDGILRKRGRNGREKG